jgi:acetate kinase
MKLLVLNAGSSSQKSCLYDLPEASLPAQVPAPLWEASIDWSLQTGRGVLTVSAQEQTRKIELADRDNRQALATMLNTLIEGETQVIEQLSNIAGVGHRVVHGGETYTQPTRITPAVKATIDQLSALAPAHNPVNLAGIEAIEAILGEQVPQVAVFDTAFHSTLPLAAAVYPIPYEWFEKGVRRYGFHGISHDYCSQRAAALLGHPATALNLITCHLGNGCSLAAVKQGVCIDTTMGFTPLEGLMMGSRSGSIDPAILTHLMREYGYDADRLDQLLNKESGLKGVSGLSNDFRVILKAMAEGNARAQLAFDLYVHRLCKEISALLPALGHLDALVFTAGIGEHNSQVREAVCQRFQFLSWQLDPAKNQQVSQDQDISTETSAVRILVIHTQEDWAIAQACWGLLQED